MTWELVVVLRCNPCLRLVSVVGVTLWQLPHAGGAIVDKAAAIRSIWVVVSALRGAVPMAVALAGTVELMVARILAAVAPPLVEVASGPWQPAQ